MITSSEARASLSTITRHLNYIDKCLRSGAYTENTRYVHPGGKISNNPNRTFHTEELRLMGMRDALQYTLKKKNFLILQNQ